MREEPAQEPLFWDVVCFLYGYWLICIKFCGFPGEKNCSGKSIQTDWCACPVQSQMFSILEILQDFHCPLTFLWIGAFSFTSVAGRVIILTNQIEFQLLSGSGFFSTGRLIEVSLWAVPVATYFSIIPGDKHFDVSVLLRQHTIATWEPQREKGTFHQALYSLFY